MSTTIIDALIIELGLDAGDLAKKAPVSVAALKKLEDQGGKAEKSVGKISKTSKETARSIEGLSRVVTSFLAVIGGTVALKAFIGDFIETNAQLDRLSKNLGISVSTISSWSNATERLGGSAQGLQGTFDMLSKEQTKLLLTGESGLIPFFSSLGVSMSDAALKARPVDEILLDLADRFSGMDRTTANNLGRMMGIDQGTMNLLLQGRKELELTLKRQKEGIAVTKAQAEAASKLQTRLVDVKQGFASLGRSLLMEAVPVLEKVLGWFQKISDWAHENKEFIADALKVLAVGLGLIGLAMVPLDIGVVAVIALGAAIALLWQDYQVWARGGKSEFDWTAWVKGITFAKDAVKGLAEWLIKAYEAWSKWMNRNATTLNGGAGHLGTAKDNGRSLNGNNGGAGHLGTTRDRGTTTTEMKDFFIKQGWNPAQAAGIVANLMSESGGDPNKKGDSELAYGLAQWHPDRQAAFKQWAGHDIRDSNNPVAEQLAFVQFELTRGSRKSAGDALRGTTNPKTAGEIVSRQYESPRDVEGEAAKRGAYAQSLLFGIPGAASHAANAPGAAGGAGTTIDKSVKTTIDTITINTNATDAKGIANDMEKSLDYLFVSQANTGLN